MYKISFLRVFTATLVVTQMTFIFGIVEVRLSGMRLSSEKKPTITSAPQDTSLPIEPQGIEMITATPLNALPGSPPHSQVK